MNFALIICTYQRPQPLLNLLKSVREQSLYPNDIIIVDGSVDKNTEEILNANSFKNLRYFKVSETERGLTKQRNIGISKLQDTETVACFLDDDIILKPDYFQKLIETYNEHPQALGVGGYIVNDVEWKSIPKDYNTPINEFSYDGFARPDGSRFILRKRLGLDADRPPAHLPEFSHGRSVSFLPPSHKTYPVEQLMGGVSSFKTEILKKYPFSEYFEGYGLYEDADYTLRLSSIGKLYVNTAAQCEHHHNASGRPNQFKYGKMVVKNGWYVWRVRWPKPSLNAKLKWHAIVWLLTLIKLTNVFTTNESKKALTESLGRIVAWWQLLFMKPRHNDY
jgi:glycosyltransferase involved in cell wall biosynthesis